MATAEPEPPSDFEKRETRLVPAFEGSSAGAPLPAAGPDSVPAPRLSPGAVLIGRFRIVRLLGRGGMGEVYLAEDIRLDRKVALKVLSPALAKDPQYLQRFRREARAASALNHPNVCVIHEVGEAEDGSPFMAMEFVEGETVDARLERGPLPMAEVVTIAIQVADALDAAHQKGIVHRDIKGANVSLNEQGRVKVLDFGLAKSTGEGVPSLDTSSMMSTQTGMVLGTPYAMSPEQALGRPLDHRSDLFSLGVLLYELVTRRKPFSGAGVGEVIERIVHAQPEAMARFNYELPPELERIVRKCLEKPPDRRYQSARELVVDLKNLLRGLERAEGGADGSPPAASPAAPALGEAARVSVETRPVEELKDSDIFLSYASIDDQPVVSGRQGWITQFHRNLKVRLEQLSGEPVRIWPQANPLGKGEAPEEVNLLLPEAKTLVSVLSPPFVRSEGCRSQVSAFWKSAEESGSLEVDRQPRLFKVVKSPVDSKEFPADVAPFLHRLRSFEFFEWDPDSGRLREFDEAFGDLALQRYHERVYDVAYELRQVLKNMQARDAAARKAAPGGKTIFLAATTADLAAQRDQLQRELIALGHRVVPERPLPIVASELEAAVRSYLVDCDLAIHMVGDRYGLVPEDTELSVVALQNRVAAEVSSGDSLKRFVWIPRGLVPRDERQAAFLRELARDPEVHRGAEVISDTLENLKTLLRARWSKEAAPKEAEAAGGSARPPRLYLICAPEDEKAIEPLEDFFYEQGIEVSLPGFEAGEDEHQQIHIQNLTDCDGAIIFYGAAGNHWVDFNIRDLQKAQGYRGSLPIGARAVYVAAPLNHRKERFKSVSTEVIRQAAERFEPAALSGFVRTLKEAREGRG
jgi:serine/threonine protein kinase